MDDDWKENLRNLLTIDWSNDTYRMTEILIDTHRKRLTMKLLN